MKSNFFDLMINNAMSNPEKTALKINQCHITYGNLLQQSFLLSRIFMKFNCSNSVCLILSNKSEKLFYALLACFFSNSIYMPVSANASIERNKQVINIAKPSFIFVGDIDYSTLLEYLPILGGKAILISNIQIFEEIKKINSLNPIYYVGEYLKKTPDQNYSFPYNLREKDEDSIAYLFFTSGSTGVPKGVPISYCNLNAYILSMLSLFSFNHGDSFSQISDISFDLSMHEIILCWASAGKLCVYTDDELLGLAKFLFTNKISHAIFLPSSIPVIVDQLSYYHLNLTHLKNSFFCGEALPIVLVDKWRTYIPNSFIVNLYGPTETTIACSYHIHSSSNDYSQYASLPIGRALPSVKLSISEDSELLIAGNQVACGYWPNLKNCSSNPRIYHSGDCVVTDPAYGFIFKGRLDDQWQVRGYRIEKSEVQIALRSVFLSNDIFVLPVYLSNGLIDCLAIFTLHDINKNYLNSSLRSYLPEPLIPRHIFKLDAIPKLSNGKVNYSALERMILTTLGMPA